MLRIEIGADNRLILADKPENCGFVGPRRIGIPRLMRFCSWVLFLLLCFGALGRFNYSGVRIAR
jgi:hypothetical protein